MASKQKLKEAIQKENVVLIDFDLNSLLEKYPEGKNVICKYFSSVWDIFKLNYICNSYLNTTTWIEHF